MNKLRQSLMEDFNIIAIALYGSTMYKKLSDTRDIDAFAIVDDKGFNSGRIDIYISLNDCVKRASVYLISEEDLYADIYEQKFGGRWSILFYHGYISDNGNKCFQYYQNCMSAIVYQYRLEIKDSPMEFYRTNNIYICMQFPFYAKSSLDFYKYPALRLLNYQLFEKIYLELISNKSVYNVNPNRLHDYLASEFMFRSASIDTVRKLDEKLGSVLGLIEGNRTGIIHRCGIERYNSLLIQVNEVIAMYKNMKSESEISAPFKMTYYGKKYI